MNLADKTIVITGGTDGLGLALAKALVAKQANVVIIGRVQAKVDQSVNELGDTAVGYVADVRNFDELALISKKLDQVDVLVNNAGVWLEGLITDNSATDIANTVDTNLTGVIYATKAFLPKLTKGEETHIFNISSTSGLRGRENQAVYVASKYGVAGFTESLKSDLAKTNIKVTGFYPGGMNTNLFKKAGSAKMNSDWMDVHKVAKIIVFMLEQDASLILDHVVLNKRKT